MEEDLGKQEQEAEIELKPKKPRSEAQLKAFERAREIRLENSKIKKEKIAQIKEEVKNRPKEQITSKPPVSPLPLKPDESDEEVVIVKKKKKPKIIYLEESDEDPAPTIKKIHKSEPTIHKSETPPAIQQIPQKTIRFC